MSEDKTPSADLAAGLRSIFDRVGEFFHIFDLSFFVGGASTFAALAFLYVAMKKPVVFPFAPWVGGLALVLACYVCGLLAFAVGREISSRSFRRRTLADTLPKALAAHGLHEASISAYVDRERPDHWWLYLRMWSEIVHGRTMPLVLHHLMRYWAMAATYDAVAFSLLVWALVLVAAQFTCVAPRPIGAGVGTGGAAACLLAALFAFRRGADYYKYQIEDVVAHFAVVRRPLIEPSSTARPRT